MPRILGAKRESFGPQQRVKRRADFLRIQAGGSKHSSKHFLLAVVPRAVSSDPSAPPSFTRLGLTVTKKVDKRAARRNRLKRRLRECFRKTQRRFQGPAVDLVVIARDRATECDYEQVRKEFQYLLYQAKVLVSSKRAQDQRISGRNPKLTPPLGEKGPVEQE